jgi:hypothetical protein
MKRALEELSWLPEWAPWVLAIGVVAVFIAVLVLKRFCRPP